MQISATEALKTIANAFKIWFDREILNLLC